MRAMIVVGAMASVAHAQPAPDEQPPVDPPPVVEPAPTPPPEPIVPAIDPAWSLYDDAFGRAAKGDREAARTRLLELSTRWPSHPAAMRATRLAAELAPRPRSKKSGVARGELVFWSTLGGVLVAANICEITECSTDRENAAVYSLSVGGSLGLALAASRKGVEPGQAQLYNSSQTWGSWNALAINDGFAEDSDGAAISLASQAAGLGAGLLLWETWRPTQGDVALTNSAFFWSAILGVWGHIATDADEDGTLRRIVIIGDLGILAGAALSQKIKMSRGRTLLIDIGGVLGTLAGGLVAVGTDDAEPAGTALFVGTAAGLAIAAFASRNWDAPDVPVSLAPTRVTDSTGRGAWGVSARLAW